MLAPTSSPPIRRFALLLAVIAALFAMNLFFGSVHLQPAAVVQALQGRADATTAFIVVHHRLPQALTALLVGAALAASGLILQTTFHNPLAGPSVLGISGGASLGVAVLLLSGFAASATLGGGLLALYASAFLCSAAVTAILLLVSSLVRDNVLLLIVGMLLGYLVSAVVTLLFALATPEALQRYVVWGMGDFSSVSLAQLPHLSAAVLLLLSAAMLFVKPLNALQLGDNYARNLGVSLRSLRNAMLTIVGLLTAVTTTYCGPIAFIGLAVPHIARFLFRTADHLLLLPATILCGSAVALLCSLLSTLPAHTILPLNAVTPFIGIPVIIWVILRRP